ncbi:MAG TPA: hypothetical protein VK994_00985, partial [Bacteroidales bacterium]|nr:hypothetical protein [Bacteroidales bacterium]
MVNHITFQTFAYPGAPEKMHMEGADTLRHLLPGAEVSQEDKPQLIMFLSGGSEALAIKQLDKNSYQVLLAGSGSNAFASAM